MGRGGDRVGLRAAGPAQAPLGLQHRSGTQPPTSGYTGLRWGLVTPLLTCSGVVCNPQVGATTPGLRATGGVWGTAPVNVPNLKYFWLPNGLVEGVKGGCTRCYKRYAKYVPRKEGKTNGCGCVNYWKVHVQDASG